MKQHRVLFALDGVITAVNPETAPDAMHDMDLGDATLPPGFIDARTHLGGQIGATSFTDTVTPTVMNGRDMHSMGH